MRVRTDKENGEQPGDKTGDAAAAAPQCFDRFEARYIEYYKVAHYLFFFKIKTISLFIEGLG